MAVITVSEITNRSTSHSLLVERTKRSWTIKVDSLSDNSLTIGSELIGSTLPTLFQAHPNNIYSTARSMQIVNTKGLIWKATADYSTEPITQSQKERSEAPNPIDRRVKISWASNSYDMAVVKDIDGNAVVNSAGDYYDPVPSQPWESLSFQFRKNYLQPPTWMVGYLNSVSTVDIVILGITIPAGYAKFTQPNGGEEQEENGQTYYEASWQIEANVRPWQLQLLDEGMRRIDPSDATKRIKIQDGNDPAEDITSPALLDGSGGVLANPSLTTAVFNDHKGYYVYDYSGMPGVTGVTA